LKGKDGYKAFKAALTDIVDAVEIHALCHRSVVCLSSTHVAKSETLSPNFIATASLLQPENTLSFFHTIQFAHRTGAATSDYLLGLLSSLIGHPRGIPYGCGLVLLR
jgi:hypothetical protein